MSADFIKGRLYERREILSLIAELLNIKDQDIRTDILQTWAVEAAESMELPKKRVVVIEDTYIVI